MTEVGWGLAILIGIVAVWQLGRAIDVWLGGGADERERGHQG